MEDYAPDPYDEGAPQNYPLDSEGVGASSAAPDVLASQAPSRTYGRPPRGVAPPCGWAAGNAETDPSYLNMAMGYNDPGELVFDPGTGSWVKVTKHKHKKKKGGQSLPTMLPGMPPMGFGMYGNPMMGSMGMPVMPASMPAAFPGMYPGMTPPVASGSGFSGKSSKKDIKHEARKEVKKMLKKEKEEEERQAEKEARRRRKEMERKWEEDEERERERQRKLRKEQERHMEEEARARAIQDAREKEARQAAERDAMEQARIAEKREEREARALADLRREQQRRAVHEERARERQLAKKQEERRAEVRAQEEIQQVRRQQALAGVEEAARIGARSPTSARNPWLSESKRLPSNRRREDDYDAHYDDDEYGDDEYDDGVEFLGHDAYKEGRYNRSPRPSSPQSYTSSSSRPPPYRSHPSSRTNSGAPRQDQGPARDWLDDTHADDTRSIRSASSSSAQAQRQIQQPKYHQTYPRHGDHLHADHHQQHRPRATSSASLSDVRAMRGNSDARSVSSACSSRSNDIRAGSENGQRGTQQGSQSDKPTYERAGSSYTYGSGSLQSSLTESAYTRSGDFIRERSHSQSYHARPPENDLHQHHSRYQKEYPASHTGFNVEHEHHEQPHHAHHNDHHRIQFSAHPKKKVDEIGEWDFDTSPGHHEKGRSLSHNPVKAISSSMDRLRIPGSSEIRRSAPVLKKKESHLEGDEDDEEAIYSRREVRSCSAASGSVASSFFRAGRLGSLDRDDRASVRSGRSAFSYVSDDARSTGTARSASSHSSNQRQR